MSALSSVGTVGGLLGSAFGSILATGSWSGVTFYAPDTDDQIGRRVTQLLFPGSDVWRYQDFGQAPQIMRVRGLIIGDDYVIRATRMRTALLTAGPATLVHPWWGTLCARLMEPATISFSDRAIGVARFEATFVREPDASTSGGLFSSIADTLQNVLTQADSLVDQATLMAQGILSPLSVAGALASSVSSVISAAYGVWNGLLGSAPVAVQTAAASALASLDAGVAEPTTNADTTWANAVVTVLSAVPAAITNAVSGETTTAVAASTAVVGDASDTVDASYATTLLLSAATSIGSAMTTLAASSVTPGTVLALGVVTRALTVSQALAAQTDETYASQPDALTSRDTMLAALDDLTSDIEVMEALAAVPVMALAQAVVDARAAVTADISDQLGRLPALVSVQVSAPVNAWLIAYAVAGDTPSEVAATWDDLVSRNALAHPALAGPGAVQALEPSS
ncbi:hypothetical protein HK28_00600 [Acetobacter sp. DsW_063]|nr:hypothetical protein HK28_00600 [Acetobacter sp. DsW_063]